MDADKFFDVVCDSVELLTLLQVAGEPVDAGTIAYLEGLLDVEVKRMESARGRHYLDIKHITHRCSSEFPPVSNTGVKTTLSV